MSSGYSIKQHLNKSGFLFCLFLYGSLFTFFSWKYKVTLLLSDIEMQLRNGFVIKNKDHSATWFFVIVTQKVILGLFLDEI